MRRQSEALRGDPEEQFMRSLEASAAASRGRFKMARELTREGVDLALKRKLNQSAARMVGILATEEAYVGNFGPARQDVAEALKLNHGPEGLVQAALVLAVSGDAARASALAAEAVGQIPPTNTFFFAIALPMARAAIHLAQRAPDEALQAMKPVTAYERSTFSNPVLYLRGLAHLAAGHGAEAASDFQKVIDRPGGGPPNAIPIANALARLGRARAAAATGDVAKSRRAYQDFLALWKDADPDVPILVQAKAEYAKLSGS
jgi:eukaryotic-like serine/threonine-protein kinase